MSNLTAEDLKLLGDLFDTKFEDKFKVVEEKIKSVHIQMDTEFKLVHERLSNLDDRLKKVEVQTTLTNGRVTTLEKDKPEHLLSCPQIVKIEQLEAKVDTHKKENDSNLAEYNMFKKYPKIALGVIIVTCISLFMGGYIAWSKFKTEIKGNIKTEISSISDSTNK